MIVEEDSFPIVRLHYDRPGSRDGETAFQIFERLFAREQPFVLIGMGAQSEDLAQSHQERKDTALWMKRNRESLHRLVKAMVYVQPQAAKRFVARAGAETFGKFWGYPMVVTASEARALAIASRLLAGEDVSAFDAAERDDAANN